MRRALMALLSVTVVTVTAAEAPYYPPAGQWARKTPAEAGMNPAKLADAMAFMKTHETASPGLPPSLKLRQTAVTLAEAGQAC